MPNQNYTASNTTDMEKLKRTLAARDKGRLPQVPWESAVKCCEKWGYSDPEDLVPHYASHLTVVVMMRLVEQLLSRPEKSEVNYNMLLSDLSKSDFSMSRGQLFGQLLFISSWLPSVGGVNYQPGREDNPKNCDPLFTLGSDVKKMYKELDKIGSISALFKSRMTYKRLMVAAVFLANKNRDMTLRGIANFSMLPLKDVEISIEGLGKKFNLTTPTRAVKEFSPLTITRVQFGKVTKYALYLQDQGAVTGFMDAALLGSPSEKTVVVEEKTVVVKVAEPILLSKPEQRIPTQPPVLPVATPKPELKRKGVNLDDHAKDKAWAALDEYIIKPLRTISFEGKERRVLKGMQRIMDTQGEGLSVEDFFKQKLLTWGETFVLNNIDILHANAKDLRLKRKQSLDLVEGLWDKVQDPDRNIEAAQAALHRLSVARTELDRIKSELAELAELGV